METEVPEKQLLSQILEAIRVTPALHEDLQVEVMKVRVSLYLHQEFVMWFVEKRFTQHRAGIVCVKKCCVA